MGALRRCFRLRTLFCVRLSWSSYSSASWRTRRTRMSYCRMGAMCVCSPLLGSCHLIARPGFFRMPCSIQTWIPGILRRARYRPGHENSRARRMGTERCLSSPNTHRLKKPVHDSVGAGLYDRPPGTAGAADTLVLYDARSRDKGYAGGHKGPHTAPHHSRPYGTMILLAKNLLVKAPLPPLCDKAFVYISSVDAYRATAKLAP